MYLLPLSNIFFHGDYNFLAAAAATKLLQLCPTLCDPIDCSPPVSPIPGTLQTRILEWVAISFSNAWKWKVKGKLLSHVRLFATPWTADYQAPPSMGFSRQEYWSGLPLPSPILMDKGEKSYSYPNKRRKIFAKILNEISYLIKTFYQTIPVNTILQGESFEGSF